MNARIWLCVITLASQPTHAAPDYSIMPGADLLFRVDLQAIRSSTIYKTLQDDPGDGEDDPALFLKNEILSVTLASDLDSNKTPVYWQLLALWWASPSVSQVQFARAVSIESVSTGFPGAAEAFGFAGLLRGSVNSGTFFFPSSVKDIPGRFGVLSEDKQSLFCATREEDARAAAERCNAGKEEQPQIKLAALVDPDAQVNFVFLTSEAMKQAVAKRLSPEHHPSTAQNRHAVEEITPFLNLKSLSFHLRLEGAEAKLAVAIDFADDANAKLGTASMERIIRQYRNLYDNELGGKWGAGDVFRFIQDGRFVRMNVTLTATELLALRNTILSHMKGSRAGRDRETCKLHLRQINANSKQFILESGGAVPTPEQLARMFQRNAVPACPAGGIYTLPTTQGEVPACSIGKDKGHSLEGK